MKVFENNLSKALRRVCQLEGVVAVHAEDEIGVMGGNYDDYLLVGYLGQLIERGEMEIKIKDERMPYLLKLLKLEEGKEQ